MITSPVKIVFAETCTQTAGTDRCQEIDGRHKAPAGMGVSSCEAMQRIASIRLGPGGDSVFCLGTAGFEFILPSTRHNPGMAHLHKKMKKGRPYYYVREMGRVGGKLKVIEQIYLGSPERIKELATSDKGTCKNILLQELGALWLANLMAGKFDLAAIVSD